MNKSIKDFVECNNSDISSLLEFLQSYKNFPKWQDHVDKINHDLKQFNVKIVNDNNNNLYLKKI